MGLKYGNDAPFPAVPRRSQCGPYFRGMMGIIIHHHYVTGLTLDIKPPPHSLVGFQTSCNIVEWNMHFHAQRDYRQGILYVMFARYLEMYYT